MHGYMGKILRINLGGRKHEIEPIREEWCGLFVGGRGIGDPHLHGGNGP